MEDLTTTHLQTLPIKALNYVLSSPTQVPPRKTRDDHGDDDDDATRTNHSQWAHEYSTTPQTPPTEAGFPRHTRDIAPNRSLHPKSVISLNYLFQSAYLWGLVFLYSLHWTEKRPHPAPQSNTRMPLEVININLITLLRNNACSCSGRGLASSKGGWLRNRCGICSHDGTMFAQGDTLLWWSSRDSFNDGWAIGCWLVTHLWVIRRHDQYWIDVNEG